MEILGYIAATITTISIFPQVIKVLKSNSTKDLSLYMWLLNFTGVSLWFTYGLLIKDMPLILGNILIIMQVSIIIFKKIQNIIKLGETT